MMNVVIANSEGETMPPEKIHRNQEEEEEEEVILFPAQSGDQINFLPRSRMFYGGRI